MLKKSRRKRVEAGHPWIYQNEVERIDGEFEPGDVLSVTDHRGKLLASAYANPRSQMIGRVVAYGALERMDSAFFIERFRRCLAWRERFVEEGGAYARIVYGEADFLPGLTVDRFGDMLVVQIVTLGMDRVRESIVEALVAVFRPKGIYERSDVAIRELEGLDQRTGVLYGECPRTVVIQENGLALEVDIVEGQKTGYFFDQRENRASLKPLMTGWGWRSGVSLREIGEAGERRVVPVNAKGNEVTFPYWDGATVLECFSHTGSFTLHACRYGAKKVTCLDISDHAVETARRNAARNGFEDRVEFVVANAFDYLREQVKGLEERTARSAAGEGIAKVDTSKPLGSAGRTWDVVILDPPAFAKTKGAVESACRGYKDINLHGMKLVNEGGFLVTASCSYHVRPETFLETIHAAAADAGKLLRLVEYRGAGKDHPQLLGVDEGNYLKFAIFEVRSRA